VKGSSFGLFRVLYLGGYTEKKTRKSNNSRWLHRVSTDPSRFTYSCGLTTWTRLLGVFHEQQLVLCSSTIACLSPI